MKAINIEWDVDDENELENLPTEIIIPQGMEDEDEISDYLSDTIGYCHKGFNLMLEKVIIYTDCLNLDHIGDFVRCTDCGALMLMQLGGTACKECKSENLQWVDENKPEWSYKEIESAGYIISEK